MRKLRIVIVGCKNMGRKHLFCLQEKFADKVKIVGILNSSTESTQNTARELGVPAIESLEKINRRKVDAVIVSTPADNHYETAKRLLEKKIPLLVEKPFASNDEQCFELIKLAEKNGVLILVGHTENYNPAVIKLAEILDCQLKSIAAIRTSKNGGVKNTHIISELMIHDLAIIQLLLQDDWNEAHINKKDCYRWDEHAIAEIKYNCGTIVRLEALREENTDIKRKMRLIDVKNNIWQINFCERELTKNGVSVIKGGDSLEKELADFINMVENSVEPLVNVENAKNIVKICNELEEICEI